MLWPDFLRGEFGLRQIKALFSQISTPYLLENQESVKAKPSNELSVYGKQWTDLTVDQMAAVYMWLLATRQGHPSLKSFNEHLLALFFPPQNSTNSTASLWHLLSSPSSYLPSMKPSSQP